MTVLARLARTRGAVERPRILVGSVSALTQRVPPLKYVASAAFSAAPGNSVRMDELALWLRDQRLRARQHSARGRRLCDARRYPRSLPARRGGADPARLLRRHAGVDPRLRPRDAAHRWPVALARSRADERGAADDRNDPPLPPGLCRRIRRADAGRRALRHRQRGPSRHRPRALAAASLRWARHAVRLCRRRALRARRAGRGGRAASVSPRSPIPTRRGAPSTTRPRERPTTSRCPLRGST